MPSGVESGGAAFTHFDSAGNAVMVDVSAKPVTERTATARALVVMAAETLAMIEAGTAKKGDVLGVARIAGIMAAKRTAELIPLCHPLPIQAAHVDFAFDGEEVLCIEASVKIFGRTGVEMEALTAAAVAALTIYDMCKAMDKSIVIREIVLVRKSGGKSGDYIRG